MSFDFNRIHDYSETDPSEGLDLFEGLSQILSDINKGPDLFFDITIEVPNDEKEDNANDSAQECANDCQDSADCNCVKQYNDSDRFFEDLSFEVKHKNKTIPVKNAHLDPCRCAGESEEDKPSMFSFSATLGEHSKFSVTAEPVDEYDEDLSHVGNAKRFVSGYLKDNPEVATILEKIDDKDVHSYSAKATKAEEAVDIITAVKKHSWVSAVVSFPVEETFEVVSQLTSKNPEIRFEIYPAGKKNILVAV